MDPRTPGFRLRHQCDQSVIDFGPGDLITRNIPSNRIQFHRLTAHASYEELVEVASRIPRRSVTFIHGDGVGLDELIDDLRARGRTAGHEIRLRAPAIGERVLLDHAARPPDWEVQQYVRVPDLPPIGLGKRKFGPENLGLSIRGLTADRRWALISVGRSAVTLALDTGRIGASQVDRLEIRARNRTRVAYDRARCEGSLARIELREPGSTEWVVSARDPDSRPVQAAYRVFCGGEARPLRISLDAAAPILELELGGAQAPEIQDVKSVRPDGHYKPRSIEWDPITRVVRIGLTAFNAVGLLEDLQIAIRWSNGFTQTGPSLGTFSVDPRVILESSFACAGIESAVRVHSSPTPLRARVAGQFARLDADRVHFTPSRPGAASLEFEYQSLTGGQEWREVATLDVRPVVRVDSPDWIERTQKLELVIQAAEPSLIGKELTLAVAAQIQDRWIASEQPYRWSGAVTAPETTEVAISINTSEFTCWSGVISIREDIGYQPSRSLRVTTADGVLQARLKFTTLSASRRSAIEHALSAAGFVIRGWQDDVLSLTGTPGTIGYRAIPIAIDGTAFEVRLVTLPDLNLRLLPLRPLHVGSTVTLHTAGGAIASGLHDIDEGPLEIRVERIAPLIDGLSAIVSGPRIRLLHPGSYRIELRSSGQVLAWLTADVASPLAVPRQQEAPLSESHRVVTADEASALAVRCRVDAPIAIVHTAHGDYQVLQATMPTSEDLLWQFLSARIAASEKVLICYPGLALSEIAGRLLSRLRTEFPGLVVAHLAYPAPRGEIATQAYARALVSHGVLCCAPANATIDRLDAYHCPDCTGTPILRTSTREIWQECPVCGYTDRDLILTLNRFRASDVQVLFSDFRIGRYLLRGRGRRYAGAFGQAVRCNHCGFLQRTFRRPSAWDAAELHRLLRALSENWNADNPSEALRRATMVASRRARRARPGDVGRIEEELRELMDCQVVAANGVLDAIKVQRLEAGQSLCCGKGLSWSKQQVANIILDLEQLLDPAIQPGLHPDLSVGQNGIRQMLSLIE